MREILDAKPYQKLKGDGYMKFVKFNANPKDVKTGDCVIRAITVASGLKYWQVVDGLLEVYKETGHIINCKNGYEEYLKRLGFKKCKMPKHENGKKYTVAQFCEEIAEPGKSYVVAIANHITAVEDKVLYDIWDCSSKCVYNYYVK